MVSNVLIVSFNSKFNRNIANIIFYRCDKYDSMLTPLKTVNMLKIETILYNEFTQKAIKSTLQNVSAFIRC